jgi:hypothetical protein
VMSVEHYNILFIRDLVDDKLQKWLRLLIKINNVTLGRGRDVFRWHLNATGIFSVRSMYLHMVNQQAPF